MRLIDMRQVHAVLLQTAADIRDAAKTAAPEALDDADRKGLLILADLIEIRAGYKVALRPALECALDDAVGLLDALDEADQDKGDGSGDEPTLGAPENHPLANVDMNCNAIRAGGRDNKRGSQVPWAAGGTWADDRKIDTKASRTRLRPPMRV